MEILKWGYLWVEARGREGESKYSDISVKGWKVGFPSCPSPPIRSHLKSRPIRSLKASRGCEAVSPKYLFDKLRSIVLNCLLLMSVVSESQSPCSTTTKSQIWESLCMFMNWKTKNIPDLSYLNSCLSLMHFVLMIHFRILVFSSLWRKFVNREAKYFQLPSQCFPNLPGNIVQIYTSTSKLDIDKHEKMKTWQGQDQNLP